MNFVKKYALLTLVAFAGVASVSAEGNDKTRLAVVREAVSGFFNQSVDKLANAFDKANVFSKFAGSEELSEKIAIYGNYGINRKKAKAAVALVVAVGSSYAAYKLARKAYAAYCAKNKTCTSVCNK